MKCDIRNHSSMTGIEKVAKSLYKYAQERLGFNQPARVVFESHGDRAVDMFSPTANYNPQTRTIKIFVDHRHPKDILRSMAHELIHHSQCCQGAFDAPVDTSPGYAQKDGTMRDLERDAYFWGNGILFRDWEDDHKSKRSWNLMNESKNMSIEEQKLRQKIRRMIDEVVTPPTTTPPTTTPDIPDVPSPGTAGPSMPEPTSPPTTTPPRTTVTFKRDEQEMKEGKKSHDCANHVKENLSGREGRCINHTLLEDGSVTHYTVEFQNEIVENIPVGRLTILEMNEHRHPPKRDDYDHDEGKPRKPFEEGEELEETWTGVGNRPQMGYKRDDEEEELEEQDTKHFPPRRRDDARRAAAGVQRIDMPGMEITGRPRSREGYPESLPEALEEEKPLKEWYNDTLHEALLRKFKIKK